MIIKRKAVSRLENRRWLCVLLVVLAGITLFFPAASVLAQSATDTPAGPAGILTSTPNADGSTTHVVQYGETLIEIAQAYGITLTQLYANNPALDPQNPKYYAGEVLIIRPAVSPTPAISPTNTPRPPTYTPRPTRTATATRTPTPVRTTTQTPIPATPTPTSRGPDNRTLGYGFIVVSGVGLLLVLLTGFILGNKKK